MKNHSKTSDGHKMTKIDLHNEQVRKERLILFEHKGREVSCSRCGSRFHLNAYKYSELDTCRLMKHLESNCPSCKWKERKEEEIYASNNLTVHSFQVEGYGQMNCLRIPFGFRPMREIKQ
jgi:Zn finger protein HypA/HybF involved in hydrogenase expression